MDISLNDLKDVIFDLWIAQRELAAAREENARLKTELEESKSSDNDNH